MNQKIKILLVNSCEEKKNLFQSYFSKEIYKIEFIKYDEKTLLQSYNSDLIIIDNSKNDMHFESLFKNHDKNFFVSIALFLYGDYKSLENQYFKYFDDILSLDHDEHLIRSKIFSIMKYYFKLNEAKAQNKLNEINFQHIYETNDCNIAFIGNDEKIFLEVRKFLEKKVASVTFIKYINYYDDFSKIFEYDFDLIFIIGVDSIHQLVYFESEIRANQNLKNAHILYIKKDTDLIFPADIINIGVNNYVRYPLEEKEFLGQTIVQLKNKKHFDDFDRITKNEINQAVKDGMTDLFNKRYLNVFLENLEKTGNFRRQIGFIMIDLDNFKKMNDTYGHFIGDQILKEFADILKKCVEKSAIAVRFGGDEFCILVMRDDDASQDMHFKTENMIEKITKLTNSQLFTDKKLELSISVGYTITQESDLIADLISRADRDMYKNKLKKK